MKVEKVPGTVLIGGLANGLRRRGIAKSIKKTTRAEHASECGVSQQLRHNMCPIPFSMAPFLVLLTASRLP